jgi:hypothetical protein
MDGCFHQLHGPALLGFRPKSAHEEDHKADQQNQSKAAAANDWSAEVKTAAAEQQKKDNHEQD